ncbi:hypothetical protein [Shouchella patagoniensis]|nr:hypothetical protein [Shouchella patagoniensis]
MNQTEKKQLAALELEIKKLSSQLQELKEKNDDTFEILETDESLVQIYN